MELINEYPVLFRYIIVSISLILVYYFSEYIIKILKLKINRFQFAIFVFGLYLVLDLILNWS